MGLAGWGHVSNALLTMATTKQISVSAPELKSVESKSSLTISSPSASQSSVSSRGSADRHRRFKGEKKTRRRDKKKANAGVITGQLMEEEAKLQGHNDAKEEKKHEEPDMVLPAHVRAVDFYNDLLRGVRTFQAWDTRKNWFMRMLMSTDGQEPVFNGRTRRHQWEYIEGVELDEETKTDQRPVNDMAFDMLKEDPQLMQFVVTRSMRWAKPWGDLLTNPVEGSTTRSSAEAIVSFTVAASILAREGPNTIVANADKKEFLSTKYAIAASTVNVPSYYATVKDDTIDFINDFSVYLCAGRQRLPDSETPYFHRPPLILNDTPLPTDTVVGSARWAITKTYGAIFGSLEVVSMLVLISLVYLSDAISRGRAHRLRTLMTPEHWSEVFVNGLGANVRILITEFSEIFVLSCVVFYNEILHHSQLALGFLLRNGWLALITLCGGSLKLLLSGCGRICALAVGILLVPVLLSASLITMMVGSLKRLARLILDRMLLRLSQVLFLQRLRKCYIDLIRLLNMFQLLIALVMFIVGFIKLVLCILRPITLALKRIFTRKYLRHVNCSSIVTCSKIVSMAKESLTYCARSLRALALCGLGALMRRSLVAECLVTCALPWEMVSQITCLWRSRVVEVESLSEESSREMMDYSVYLDPSTQRSLRSSDFE